MSIAKLPRLSFWSIVFWVIMAMGVYATFVRFTQGLGAASNLSDQAPWGLWIGFDVLCGVGLAAGGFVVAASVYIFNLDKYKPILRPAVLTAFLGYILVIIGLMFDLGRPWNIWHPIIMWNPHSVMFEVGWCVMLYTTVLALEFSPVVFERFGLTKLTRIVHSMTIPLVILGVILSSLHQSSLGSLFLIVPGKLHPLWYSSNLPYLFFISAISVGPAMVTVESYFSSRAFGREIELPILSKLGKVSAVALAVYLVLRIEDVVNMNLMPYLFTLSFESIMYWIEITLGVLVPIGLLVNEKIRSSQRGIFIASLFVVFGFIFNRLNLSLTALQHYTNSSYFPSMLEVIVTLTIVALGFAVFRLAAKHLPVFPKEHDHAKVAAEPVPYDVISFVDVPETAKN